ncbi:uncharacterized protein B0I36DRAFT_117139 [Microdochium trichocladiopsis]|uniref:Uncharacterized protein n=1 Tax=Microdochium trichocladiopsis TaxID=1682393 RepID=A0A9P8Y955_9PEZI|nr:uncharacterized protein B0I36DRAFT_117139 [Microdochium trichocladiopsis]KAH7030975.1 hypothetical protein B0I36DRAFT_117139 [Microdochium trichocladiopsis]
MSAMTALPYDSRVDFGVSRSSYTWPGLDPNADFLNNDFCSVGPSSDGGLSSSSADSRSITSSPPHPTLTAEQRELKRQRDMARRDSKTSVRAHRAMSDFRASQSPPMSMNEYNPANNLPIYTTVQPPLSLLSEPVTTLPGVSTYMPSYTSPPLSDQQSAMFTSSYEYMGISYNSGYPSASPPPPPSHTHTHSHAALSPQYRPLQEHPGIMYPAPSMLHVGGPLPPVGGGNVVSEPGHVRVVQTRPKPQCWEHGCNGRQFSTFSNLLRHQREKSGQATKSSCPNCGAEFTRTTARNGHLLHDKCKQRKNSA